MPTDPGEPKNAALKRALEKQAGKLRQVSREPDAQTIQEEDDLQIQQARAVLKGLTQDIDERKRYAKYFFILACSWLGAITTILLLQGFGSFWFGSFPFKLSENVLLAVIGSTTVNVLGILYVVANYLFPKR